MAAIVAQEEQPISRTYQYRKVMKPMLERKRRARINRCLDELKELLVGALQAEGESVSRLEKADVLELTVRHLHKLRRIQQMNETSAGERFRAGFVHCANEVSQYMTNACSNNNNNNNPNELSMTSRLMTHLDNCIHRIDSPTAATMIPTNTNNFTPAGQQSPLGLNILTNYTPPSSPVSSPHTTTFAYVKHENHHHQLPLSPSPAHLQSQSPFGKPQNSETFHHHHQTTVTTTIPQGFPISLMCRKNSGGGGIQSEFLHQQSTTTTMEEPFDLSNNVWRPW